MHQPLERKIKMKIIMKRSNKHSNDILLNRTNVDIMNDISLNSDTEEKAEQ